MATTREGRKGGHWLAVVLSPAVEMRKPAGNKTQEEDGTTVVRAWSGRRRTMMGPGRW